MKYGLTALAILTSLAAPAVAQDPIAPELQNIVADNIASARIKLNRANPLAEAMPELVRKGMVLERQDQVCTLDAGQIAAILDIVKRARPLSGKTKWIGAWMLIEFQPRGGEKFVSVIGSPSEKDGGAVRIFFNSRDALLSPEARLALGQISTEAGCKP